VRLNGTSTRITRRSSIASKSPRHDLLVRSIRRVALAGSGAEAAAVAEAAFDGAEVGGLGAAHTAIAARTDSPKEHDNKHV